jgi:signal transduction histidine kinase
MLAMIGGSLVTENRPGGGATATIFLPRESLGEPAG